jgi:DNA repair protein RadA/Sms
MAKLTVKYVCQDCGTAQVKWMGRCPACGAWNSLVEEVESNFPPPLVGGGQGGGVLGGGQPLSLAEIGSEDVQRLSTGIGELNRVLGGGLVPGSLILLGGEPGIGKSTLVLQACQGFGSTNRSVLYVSGEENLQQIQLRARRIGVQGKGLKLVSETRVERVLELLAQEKPGLLVVDSIQTLFVQDLPAVAGSVSQVRECAARLMAAAKSGQTAILLVGHVTKEGNLAGPKVLEHLVDAVLTFEGDAYHPFRVLRAAKNRFGSTQEAGLFEMGQAGLTPVENPSAYLLQQRQSGREGSAALPCLEGSRTLLVEIQALVTPTHYGTPQRSSTGLDTWRLGLLYAVLEKRCGLHLYNNDVFVSAAGGLQIREPAADLAVACAVASSLKNQSLPSDWVFFGEIGLGGELRPVQQAPARLREASRMGFRHALLPASSPSEMKALSGTGLEAHPAKELRQAFDLLWSV